LIAQITNRIFCCPAVLVGIVLLITFVATYIVGGLFAAIPVKWQIKVGKNRNWQVAALMAALSAIGATFGIRLLLSWGAGFGTGTRSDSIVDIAGMVESTGALVPFLIGMVIAVASAGLAAAGGVAGAIFCEGCEEYMDKLTLRAVSFPGLRTITAAIKQSSIPRVVQMLESEEGGDGLPFLFVCSSCGKGFVESTATFTQEWIEFGKDDAKEEKKEESWLTASRELEPSETDLLKPFVTGEAKK